MSKNNFTRSNVNEQTLMISEINRSGFDQSHRVNTTLKLGRLTPINIERLLPTDIVQGSMSPKFQLENCGTPTIGKLRLDTHTFQVNLRRIHKDFRAFQEDLSNVTTLPSFNVHKLALFYVRNICYYGANSTWHTGTWADNLTDLGVATSPAPASVTVLSSQILANFTAGLKAMLADTSTEFGWNKDFIALEVKRLAVASTLMPSDETAFPYVIYQILLPLFGEGSVLDFLGYPIYNRLGSWYQTLEGVKLSVSELIANSLSALFNVCGYDMQTLSVITVPDENYSEMPLRAIYAVYFDYFRNWHVVPRNSVLNPDDFGSSTILMSSSWATSPKLALGSLLQLLVLRFRNFSRDFLTTVQVDDIYRHVYAPIFGTDTSANPLNLGDVEPYPSNYNEIIDKLVAIGSAVGNNVPFLSDFFNSRSVSGPSVNGFAQDLQTMRRTGMLEKWLARNYFFPDTYVGQLRAHYNVVPEDINYINAQYLGGTEQLVEGNQTIAPVDTPQMDAGTRTVVSGVNASDSFTYRASDHCYIISFVSLMPIVNYDIKNMHLKELRKMDIASPEFAQDSRVAIRLKDMLRGFDNIEDVLGYVPRYYQYRVHGDETHGRYLNDYRSYSWFRDWYNMYFSDLVKFTTTDFLNPRGFVLSPYCLRVHLPLEAFNDKAPWDDIAFGSCDIQFFKNSPLPGAVDII